MLRQERVNDAAEALRLSLIGWQTEIWTAMPGIIEKVDLVKMTCQVQPAIKGVFRQKDGSTKVVTMPLCLDVPIQFLGGGGFTLTFPMAKGDEGLIVFASRCIDAWWQNGGVQPQAELRLHDLSDGFFIPGFRSQPRILASIASDSVDLRNDAGDVFVRVKAEEIDVQVKADVSAQFTKDQITMTAHDSNIVIKQSEIDINATTIKLNGLVWGTHEHTGVQSGASKTGGPTAP